jgi:hypothetical protein
MLVGLTTKRRLNTTSMKGSAWPLFGQLLIFEVILLVTDHQLLKWLMESNKLTEKLGHWALMLMEYNFKVVHRAGLVNMDADGLSYNLIPS